MATVKITVNGRVAIADATPIICGNSDYVVEFTFDSEWSKYTSKTARFLFIQDGEIKYIDVPFSGSKCTAPALYNIDRVIVGVFAGNLWTTTGAVVRCKKSILCDGGSPKEPDEDIYHQLMDLFNQTCIDPNNTVVETSYNPESYNPQSGIAVAQALENVQIDVDDTVEEGGTNPVSGDAVYNALQNVEIDVDAEMSNTSTNPVQNKVAKAYVDNKTIDPFSIDGAVVENFYNLETADIVEGKFINTSDKGKEQSNASYMYFKVRLYSNKKYRININTTYNVAVFDTGKIGGTLVYGQSIGSTKTFEIPEMTDKIITAYISCLITQYNNTKGNVIIVEGEDLPTGNEKYKISLPWLSVPENKVEDDEETETTQTFSAYSVDEVKLKQKMPPYLFDGIECNNYFDVEYMIANSTEDSRNKKYANTPYIYLPSGTYTINECYSYTLMSKDGEKGETVSAKTFTITEEYPYISFMILCMVSGVYDVNYLRKISVQKGESATANVPSTYKFNEKFDLKGSVKYYPTHWQGKKYVAIGDSITFGYNPKDESEGISSGGQMAYPYSRIVAENLNMERFNAGESGANVKCVLGLVDGYDNQVQQAIDFNADLVTVMIGVNDSSAEGTSKYVPLGTIDDVYDESDMTFYSGLSEIVSRIQTALPNATIILLSSPKNNATLNQTKQNYFKAVKDVAEKYDVLFYDIHNGCGFNTNNPTVVSNFVLTDVHPNHRAHKVIGNRLTGFIASH